MRSILLAAVVIAALAAVALLMPRGDRERRPCAVGVVERLFTDCVPR